MNEEDSSLVLLTLLKKYYFNEKRYFSAVNATFLFTGFWLFQRKLSVPCWSELHLSSEWRGSL